jgi:DNA-binding PadR family transcriptional regulator
VALLAAIDRAERHRSATPADTHQTNGEPLSRIVNHLGLVHGSWTTRRLRPQLAGLEDAGILASERRRGVLVWKLTDKGRRRLARARRAGQAGALPESPQHREWREAHAAAAARRDEFHEQTRRAVEQARDLLDNDQVGSDDWFELGERLRQGCWLLGSATHCLHEWIEPDDHGPDIDDYVEPSDEALSPEDRASRRTRRSGRRNIRNWDHVK